jgi:hypothetical protein
MFVQWLMFFRRLILRVFISFHGGILRRRSDLFFFPPVDLARMKQCLL